MIRVYANSEELSRGAAEFVAQQAQRARTDRGRFIVALSGGHTPQRAYELLAQPPLRDAVPWQQAHVFWGDERCVPADDPQSNQHMARRILLDHVAVPPNQIHPVSCSDSPIAAAAEYESILRSFFAKQPSRFDLVLLGLGENGHTASLFPGTPVLSEEDRWVAEVAVPDQDFKRVTLTAPVINQAAVVAFLVSGAAKAEVLAKVINGPPIPDQLPAQLIRPIAGDLHWFIDQEANGVLQYAF